MNHPVEEAASHAASQISKLPLAISWAGNAMGFLVSHEKELQVTVLLLTIMWTLWQWGRSLLQEQRDRRVRIAASRVEAWARRQGMRTKPGELTPERRHATSPTLLWDDTYSGHDNGAGR